MRRPDRHKRLQKNDFNPRIPQGMRLSEEFDSPEISFDFNPRIPQGMRRVKTVDGQTIFSIHAFRRNATPAHRLLTERSVRFQSTHSAGNATIIFIPCPQRICFQSTHSAGNATSPPFLQRIIQDFNHAFQGNATSSCRTNPRNPSQCHTVSYFKQSTHSAGNATKKIAGALPDQFQSTHSAGNATGPSDDRFHSFNPRIPQGMRHKDDRTRNDFISPFPIHAFLQGMRRGKEQISDRDYHFQSTHSAGNATRQMFKAQPILISIHAFRRERRPYQGVEPMYIS